ncbi:MAG: ATP-dependent DNA helicase [Eubacterium sp.]|nr:ATP-dependent DNA helicase [Eubacterium sp.]MCM1217480.1 ATP-dependent DNA helicase [Lachnospiraceae bacterium]MCM1302521.1 ATP-dependent DNA helicase [Butyrivibrio sp.]MCM1065498.1 ATP-dependent DNA helicase [Eubacterium sp.]MCM1238010.1 ATP-dependent DNA helicase [Lachnospiraceae bacterium]
MEIRVSVRTLVEFILRHGDIDNRRHASFDNAMQEGGRIHRMIQRRMGAEYEAEVTLRYTLPTDRYILVVEGRADGIIRHEGQVIIDEIKGTYRDLEKMKGPMPLHIAQAKCYAYICALKEGLKEIRVRMTYCNMETEGLRYFHEDFMFQQLEDWFGGLVAAYRKWADYSCEWQRVRQGSISGLEFPFPYREGQRELVAHVYRTIYHKKKLFLEAPTGVGKTISTIYPAVQAMGQGMAEKLFYLTAKTITRTVADETFALLREKGLHFKSVILTAKEKSCFMEHAECNPEYCPYAKGHYDRINDALYDLLISEESFSRERIAEYAEKYQVCPFEMCLDMSLFADAVICDYNYLFDPHVYLKRFFAEGNGGKYIFLIDEAHNLLERGREMYSASLYKNTFLEIRRELKQTILSETSKPAKIKEISGQMTLDMTGMSYPRVERTEIDQIGTDRLHGGRSILIRQGYASQMIYHMEKCNEELLVLKRECDGWRTVEEIDRFMKPLMRLHAVMDEYLSEQEEEQLPVREQLLDLYFDIGHFLEMYELLDEHYVKYTQLEEEGDFLIKLFCVNPAENLKNCMLKGRSAILFSATFLPIQYYKKLLGGEDEDYEVYAKPVFDPERCALFLASDVTSKYTRRSDSEYYNIARYIDEIVKNRHGNYMVFCPSYAFLHTIYDIYMAYFANDGKECILQGESMSESDREDFLSRFRGNPGCDLQTAIDSILIGFCVMGGIFSEGIDLKNDSLIGAILVGTGLPQVCSEREILKGYFDREGENGFDYSYRYPGMNKVLQAAGRVIRTVEDVGIIALLDERFLQMSYRRLFPREWERFETVTVDTVAKRVERFWDSWL